MRSLTSKQKKLIIKWFSDKKLHSVYDLTDEQWRKLEEIKSKEILYPKNVDIFIDELHE